MPSCQLSEWKPIPSTDGFYEASADGKIRSVDHFVERYNYMSRQKERSLIRGRELKPCRAESGHLQVRLSIHGKTRSGWVHRLVLEAFAGPCPKGQECRHYDDNPSNNAVTNISWGTHEQNMRDKIRLGTVLRGEKNGASKLMDAQAREIVRLVSLGIDQYAIAEMFGIQQSTVSRIANGVRWTHLQGK